MSEKQLSSIFGETESDIWDTVEAAMGKVSPKLIQELDEDDDGEPETRRELDPIVVTRLGGTLHWETESMQIQSGATVTSSDGDENIRLVMEAVITETQREKLMKMRENPATIKLVSRSYTGPVTFDELKLDRIADANGAETRTHGTVREPMYEILLQSKERND